jgi:hypothetical protein
MSEAFYAKSLIDMRLYRMLVRIEGVFTHLLITRP